MQKSQHPRRLALFLLFSLSPTFAVYAAESGTSDRALLSETGRRKVGENLAIISSNIKSLQEGIGTIQKNIKVLHEELAALDSLERDHLELKKKYDAYLGLARREINRNETALKKMDGRGVAAVENSGAAERKKREAWREDSAPKLGRVEGLMRELMKNLAEIQSRRNPVRAQLHSWTEREREYDRSIRDFSAKKSELERLAGR